ncbi:DUF6298 domain-containing protein [Pseudanabaena sp. PCC 6802]|uniref:DUF6298 domain-containing protein n=1 Tax=Pseudanabaena sp. PCC 6802 TaxID=118173 RepID=UPI00034C9D7D|nr:DUF6298 domain-containing protein [Pseudanabaena sp. PCC 6802]
MSKSQYLLSRKTIGLLGLFVIVLCISLLANKIPRIATKILHLPSEIQRIVKFNLSPNIAVTSRDKISIQPLTEMRATSATGVLRVNPTNPRYFTDGGGKAVYLTGSHTWSNLQDSGGSPFPPKFDYATYLGFLQKNNHNFFRLWTWETSGPWIQTTVKNYWFYPIPYQRIGSDKALDGEPKFDLTQFNQAYFDRLRERVKEAGNRGIYVSVMLFNGWSVDNGKGNFHSSNPWRTHPFNKANNINGIDGDFNGDNNGEEIHTLVSPAVTAIQDAYVRKVIDTVNDFDNVLYEISNESNKDSQDWQYHMTTYIKNYERRKPKQHPVGMTAFDELKSNSPLFDSPADWISPIGDIDERPVASGKKVILADTDHLCGICGNNPQWVWKSFTNGENPIFMDAYDNAFVLGSTLINQAPPDSLNYSPWVVLRRYLGYTLTYANRMNLAAMTPQGDLASTGYCLANPASSGAEYLVYAPSGGRTIVDLSATKHELVAEWLNPSTGIVTSGIKTAGGGNRSFFPPFSGEAVLYIKDASPTYSQS